jgi:hypothetical protein
VGKSLDEIVGSTTRVNALLSEIAAAAREQSDGITQINTGVNELDKVTQGNAGNAEELASSAEETSAQVSTLRKLVGQFRISSMISSHAAAGSGAPSKGQADSVGSKPRRGGTPAPAVASRPTVHAKVAASPAASKSRSAMNSAASGAAPADGAKQTAAARPGSTQGGQTHIDNDAIIPMDEDLAEF